MGDLVKRLRECADCKDSEAWRRLDGGQDLCIGAMLANDAADRIDALEAEVARLNAGTERQAGASRTLRASIMAEVQAENAHLRAKDRSEYTATATLESERQANAMLTAEIDRLTATLTAERAGADALAAALRDIMTAYSEPDRRICCSGASEQCGCMGATVREEADHYAAEALAAHDARRKGGV